MHNDDLLLPGRSLERRGGFQTETKRPESLSCVTCFPSRDARMVVCFCLVVLPSSGTTFFSTSVPIPPTVSRAHLHYLSHICCPPRAPPGQPAAKVAVKELPPRRAPIRRYHFLCTGRLVLNSHLNPVSRYYTHEKKSPFLCHRISMMCVQ